VGVLQVRGCSLIKRKIPPFLSSLSPVAMLFLRKRGKKGGRNGENQERGREREREKERERERGREREREGKERNGTSLLLAREEEEVEGSPPGCQAGWHAT